MTDLERAEVAGELLLASLRSALRDRAADTSLVIRISEWGPTARYEWSSTGPDARGPNLITSRDNPTLGSLEAALLELGRRP